MLKLKLKYFGHLMGGVGSFEKTLMLGKTEGRRRKGQQKIRCSVASPIWWIWVWASSRSWWWTGRPGVLQSMGWQRVGHNWAAELNWNLYNISTTMKFIQPKAAREKPAILYSWALDHYSSSLKTHALIWWRGRWEGGLGWGIHVNPWLIHVSVWQKPLQYCKVISLQLIKINGKKKHTTCTAAFSVVWWLSLHNPSAGGQGLTPAWGTRSHSHRLQLRPRTAK